MSDDKSQPEKEWGEVKDLLERGTLSLSAHWSYNLLTDPKRLAFVLSRYKFAAKMCSRSRDILELGCSEGIGATILSEFANTYTGVDIDETAINSARQNLPADKFKFIEDDFLGKSYGLFDSVISLDVVEHINTDIEHLYFETIFESLRPGGIAIVGTPNITAQHYASYYSNIGHVNMFDAARLKNVMGEYFHTCFLFSMNDEIVHTGFYPMAHYLICIGCYKKPANKTLKWSIEDEGKESGKRNSSTGNVLDGTGSTDTKMKMGDGQVAFGYYLTHLFLNTPRRLLFTISYYKFASKLIGAKSPTLDVGCNEGLGTWLLATECGMAHGIDSDRDAIGTANANWSDGGKISFEYGDFLDMQSTNEWKGVVSLDVIEHIHPEHADRFFRKIVECLSHDGIAVIGTPNINSQQYASAVSKAGHVNLYSAERLEKEMLQYFTHVFVFAANDEVVHTGFYPMAHYLIAVGCQKRRSPDKQ